MSNQPTIRQTAEAAFETGALTAFSLAGCFRCQGKTTTALVLRFATQPAAQRFAHAQADGPPAHDRRPAHRRQLPRGGAGRSAAPAAPRRLSPVASLDQPQRVPTDAGQRRPVNVLTHFLRETMP